MVPILRAHQLRPRAVQMAQAALAVRQAASVARRHRVSVQLSSRAVQVPQAIPPSEAEAEVAVRQAQQELAQVAVQAALTVETEAQATTAQAVQVVRAGQTA
jgi:hypothetical protein